ncbi:MAG TPA: TetR/AcrR family transcriptional regulator [Verrucomicrobiae bacterium]|nr:TetR/AcrR family transcriptional regulator [Verrucomicrobiae bacterium]
MTSTRSRTGGRSARVVTSVLDAAVSLLADEGSSNFTVAAVAERAGVHETSIYRRWRTKEALINEAILTRTSADLPVPNHGSVGADLLELLGSALKFLRSPIGGALVRMTVALPPSEQSTAFKRAFWAGRFPAILTVLERGVERGELDPNLDCQFTMEMIIGLIHVRVFLMDNSDDDGLAERAIALVLRGAECRGNGA